MIGTKSAVADAMSLALDSAWQKLSGNALASSGYADATRETLAMLIMESARLGEHDVARLSDDALAFVLEEASLAAAAAPDGFEAANSN